MNKRLLYKNKIIKFYEEDIWGIFYKKQLRRDFFFKKFMYLFFLNKIFQSLYENNKFSYYKNDFKYLLSNIFKIRVYFPFINWKTFYENKNILRVNDKFLKVISKKKNKYLFLKKKNYNNNNYVILNKTNNFNFERKYSLYLIKNLKYFKKFKVLMYKFLFFNILKSKNLKSKLFKFLKKKFYFFNNFFKTKNNIYNIYIISSILKKKNNNKILNLKISQLNKLKNLLLLNYKYKKTKNYDYEYQYISFNYFKFLKSYKKKKLLYLKLILFDENFVYGKIKINKMFIFLKNICLLLKKNNKNKFSFICTYNFFLYFFSNKNIKKKIKQLKYIYNLIKFNNFKIFYNFYLFFYKDKKNYNNAITNFDIKLLNSFKNFNNFFINKYVFNILLNKYLLNWFMFCNKLKNFSTFYIKYYLIKFIKLNKIKYKNVKNKKIFFVLRKIVNLNKYIYRRVKKMKYFFRNFYYKKYNNFEDKDSLFYNNKIDLTKIDISIFKTKKDREQNFVLLNYIKFLNKKKEYLLNYKEDIKIALKYIITKPNVSFCKTEYLLSFYASNKIYKIFKSLRVFFFSKILKEINVKNLDYKKYSKFLNSKLEFLKKKQRFYSIKKKKTILQKIFTLNLVPIVKYVKKKKQYNSFYKYKMLKVWKFRKFYGCLTNYELKHICYKAYKYHGDILLQFIILLESRVDTLLYRTGIVSSIFEARQLINHKNILINNRIINKRSFILKKNDILFIDKNIYFNLINKTIFRINNEGILFRPPIYLEVNFNIYMVVFLFDILKVKQVPFNFNLTGEDLNTILYYYY